MRHYSNWHHIIGYVHHKGHIFGHILRVNGKNVQYIPVPHICVQIYKTLKKTLGSVL